jgi:sugar phosphate permease
MADYHMEDLVSEINLASARLARRFDARILAPLTFLYFICYLDRANLANAKAPISAALSLSTAQYGLASSIFQVG